MSRPGLLYFDIATSTSKRDMRELGRGPAIYPKLSGVILHGGRLACAEESGACLP